MGSIFFISFANRIIVFCLLIKLLFFGIKLIFVLIFFFILRLYYGMFILLLLSLSFLLVLFRIGWLVGGVFIGIVFWSWFDVCIMFCGGILVLGGIDLFLFFVELLFFLFLWNIENFILFIRI